MTFPSRRAKGAIVLGIVLWVFIDLSYVLASGFWFAVGYIIGVYLLLFGLAWHASVLLQKFKSARSTEGYFLKF